MNMSLNGKLVVAISSRALFDFEEENKIFEQNNAQEYMQLQRSKMDDPAKMGVAFSLVKKLLAFNEEKDNPPVEVVIISRNDPATGLRVMRSATQYGLSISRCVFTKGRPAYPYLIPFHANLFLSANLEDVKAALRAGFPAAHVYPRETIQRDPHPTEIRIAFDGDAVLFSDEAEKIYQEGGLEKFQAHEKIHADRPLPDGPFKPLLVALNLLQQDKTSHMKIRTTLVTARNAPAHERAIKTLMNWKIEVDEAMFLGGLPKGEFLRQFEPDFFFDDQLGHIDPISSFIPSGHVVSGVKND